MNIVLSLDYSTSCTGWAIFNDGELKTYGCIKPKVKGVSKLKYPKKQLEICIDIANQLKDLILKVEPDIIVMEEINKHKNRLSGKTLDGGHFIFYFTISEFLDKIIMMDSDGMSGWRTKLNFRLSDADKEQNKEYRKLNKKLEKGTKKLPIINKKHLACRYANRTYGTSLDCDERTTDGDIADAIGLGSAFVKSIFR